MDTGPLVAAANPSDPDHETCAALLRSAEPPLVVPNPVVAEACYLIGKHLGARAEATFSGPSPEGAIGRNRRRTPTCSAPPISLSSTSTFVSEGPTPSSSQPPNVSGSRCSPPSTNGTSALYGRPMWPPSRQSPEPAVVLTGVAPAAKAALGPTAWAVLGGTDPRRRNCEDGRLAVTTSVRRLGTALGLDKDTVARALSRLSSDGFVLRCSTDRPADGSRYVIISLSGLTRVGAGSGSDPVLTKAAVRPSNGDRPGSPEVGDGTPRRSRRAHVADVGRSSSADQLCLLGDDVAPSDAMVATTAPTPDRQIRPRTHPMTKPTAAPTPSPTTTTTIFTRPHRFKPQTMEARNAKNPIGVRPATPIASGSSPASYPTILHGAVHRR